MRFIGTVALSLVMAIGVIGQKGITLAEAQNLTTPEICGTGDGETEMITGVVMKRDFDESETRPAGFVLKDKKDQRYYINFDTDFISQLSGNSVDSIAEAVTKGSSLRVKADRCGHLYVARRLVILRP